MIIKKNRSKKNSISRLISKNKFGYEGVIVVYNINQNYNNYNNNKSNENDDNNDNNDSQKKN